MPSDRQRELTAWPADDAAAYRAAGYWRGATFPEVLAGLVDAHGDRTAVVDDRSRLTYRELDEQATSVAHGLRGLGLRTGDRVLVQLPNRAEFLVLWWALMKIGAVPVHTQPGHRASEMTHLAALTAARAYAIPDVHASFDHRELAAQVRTTTPSLEHVIVVGDPGTHTDFAVYDDLASTVPQGPPLAAGSGPGDIALLLLSGGTTGLPKLIPRTHDDYLYNSRAAAEVCRMSSDCVYLAALPAAFNYTMNCPGVLGALELGGTVVMAANPDPAYCFTLIERERVTITAINPQLTPVWLDELEQSTADLSSLQVLQIGSARLADEVARRVLESFDCTLQQVFGMAEGLICLTRLDDPPEVLATTQGRPISPADEVRVVDDDDNDVAPGEPGELLTRGPYTLRGYYRADEHNSRSFTADGFYRSGDMVRALESGHLVVVGRKKDQINRGGEKIAATEVEGHLLAHPGVRHVALVAGADEDLGERSVAFVVPAAVGGQEVAGPAAPAPPTRRDLATFLAERGLAPYKAPDQVEIIDAMPLTPLGKIDKKVLAARLRA